jgi:hypothetical protein
MFATYLTRDFPWLRELVGREAEKWIDAVEAIDLRGDKKPLLELLKSDQPLPKAARRLLADLLTRYQLKRRRSRPQVPIYMLTKQTIALQKAKKRYAELRKTRVSRSKALERVAKESRVSRHTIENYVDGKNAFSRTAEKQIEAFVHSAFKS